MLKKKQHPPAYVDGELTVYDIVQTTSVLNPDFPESCIKAREGLSPIAYRELAIFDRTRLLFEQAGKHVTMKVAIPRYSGISSDNVVVINGDQYKVFNAAVVQTKDGFDETELTLETPEVEYAIET